MTDDVNLARPEEGANPAQPAENTSPAQPEEGANPAQPAENTNSALVEEVASEVQPDDVPVDHAPAAGSEPIPDPAAERDEYRDLLLRKQAEFDNYKKRVKQDEVKANRQAERALISALLPLLDDFERALGAPPVDASGVDAYRAGVEIIHRQLLEILRKRGVTPIDTAGARFDPNLHEAVAYQASDGHEDGDVIDELRRGYRFDEELLRAAMVRVAKA